MSAPDGAQHMELRCPGAGEVPRNLEGGGGGGNTSISGSQCSRPECIHVLGPREVARQLTWLGILGLELP